MSQEQIEVKTETREDIKARAIDVETIKRLLKEATPAETKYLLFIREAKRHPGCGWKYLYSEELSIVMGSVETIVLDEYEHNCDEFREVLVIPKTIPAIVALTYRDENPEIHNTVTFYIFTAEGWKKVTTPIPKEDP
jgi:hypothetical protein